MTKINAIRRFLLPCLHPTATSPVHPSTVGHTQKKRISTSLRDDIDDLILQRPGGNQGEEDVSEPPTPTATSLLAAPPRSSKTMVIGTIFGHRRGGHVWFCVHHDRLSIKPTLFLELSIPTTTLIQEMSCGLVRIALEFKNDSGESEELSRCPLHSVPVWNLYCNGRKLGFAHRRKVNQQNRALFKTMQSITVGAGVIPSGFASGFGSGTEELMYMRANYERVIGSADSESFHLINPDEGLGQELSVFLLRTRS